MSTESDYGERCAVCGYPPDDHNTGLIVERHDYVRPESGLPRTDIVDNAIVDPGVNLTSAADLNARAAQVLGMLGSEPSLPASEYCLDHSRVNCRVCNPDGTEAELPDSRFMNGENCGIAGCQGDHAPQDHNDFPGLDAAASHNALTAEFRAHNAEHENAEMTAWVIRAEADLEALRNREAELMARMLVVEAERDEARAEVGRCQQDRHASWQRAVELEAEVERMSAGLTKIRNLDYRGNRSEGSTIAYRVLDEGATNGE